MKHRRGVNGTPCLSSTPPDPPRVQLWGTRQKSLGTPPLFFNSVQIFSQKFPKLLPRSPFTTPFCPWTTASLSYYCLAMRVPLPGGVSDWFFESE